MADYIPFGDLESADEGVRAEAILWIAMIAEISQLSPAARRRKAGEYEFLGLTGDQVLAIDLDVMQLKFMRDKLVGAFTRWGDSSALWAMGKMPIEMATDSILNLFVRSGCNFDEPALLQAGYVLQVGLEADAISEGYWPCFEQFIEKCRNAEDESLRGLAVIFDLQAAARDDS